MTPEQKARVSIDTLLAAAGWYVCHVCHVSRANLHAATLTGVELQSSRYAQGLPARLPAWRRPLPFVWESTGVETHFTNGLDTEPRARSVFGCFRLELLVQWLAYLQAQADTNTEQETAGTFLARLQHLPQLVPEWGTGGARYTLWPAQISAITNLEKSLAANKPKALIQMAIREVEPEVDTSLQRAPTLRQATLARAFSVGDQTC